MSDEGARRWRRGPRPASWPTYLEVLARQSVVGSPAECGEGATSGLLGRGIKLTMTSLTNEMLEMVPSVKYAHVSVCACVTDRRHCTRDCNGRG